MVTGDNFSKVSDALAVGFFADNVILALVRMERLGYLCDVDKGKVSEASELLERVLRGIEWINKPEINPATIDASIALNKATQALPDKTGKEDFKRHITQLKASLDKLLQEGYIKPEETKPLRLFFLNYGKKDWAEAREILG
jgi:hypothetical protein